MTRVIFFMSDSDDTKRNIYQSTKRQRDVVVRRFTTCLLEDHPGTNVSTMTLTDFSNFLIRWMRQVLKAESKTTKTIRRSKRLASQGVTEPIELPKELPSYALMSYVGLVINFISSLWEDEGRLEDSHIDIRHDLDFVKTNMCTSIA